MKFKNERQKKKKSEERNKKVVTNYIGVSGLAG